MRHRRRYRRFSPGTTHARCPCRKGSPVASILHWLGCPTAVSDLESLYAGKSLIVASIRSGCIDGEWCFLKAGIQR